MVIVSMQTVANDIINITIGTVFTTVIMEVVAMETVVSVVYTVQIETLPVREIIVTMEITLD